MLKVGLTGSIAVGKSFVTEVLQELGCFVLDSDQTAREVVKPQTEGWKLIVKNFGAEMLRNDDTIDRQRLGAIVFSNEAKRRLLNSIVHPLVFESQKKWLQTIENNDPNSIAVIDAALMIESGSCQRFDKIIVVWCSQKVQIERLMKRNNLSRDEALERINAQMSQTEKKKFADFLINTSNGFEETRQKTEEIYKRLKFIKK